MPSLTAITPHVYWLPANPATDRPMLGAVAGQHATLIVDAGNSPAHARLLLDEIARCGLPTPAYLALTHWHWDHVFGAATLGLTTFASGETRRIVGEMARQDWSDAALDRRVREGTEIAFCRDNIKAELPDRRGLVLKTPEIGFSESLELDLGGLTCRLVHVGGDHSADSSVVWVEDERVLFLGDCLYFDLYSGPDSLTTRRFLPLAERILSFGADFYMESHAPAPTPRREMEAFLEMTRTIGLAVDRTGPHRPAALSALQSRFGSPLTDDQLEIMDAFLAGLAKN
jgi:glyoxylase-like metal-dependent hydrolase (beta-lactamase superfamily II)